MECRLGEIGKLYKGFGISKDQLSDNGEPCILYGELYTKYTTEAINNIISKTNISDTKLVKSNGNDVIIPCSGETAEDIATARCVLKDNVLLGGDLNIIRLHKDNGLFMSYQLNGKRKYDITRVSQGVSVVHLYGEHLKGIKTYCPNLDEQNKIATFLSLLDERIATQNKIIEELKQLKNGIIEKQYKNVFNNCRLGDVIKQTSIRNKNKAITNILSVNNKSGFINQREQFEDRIIASDDISNYKIVEKKHFAYNPARINVGSIAQLKTFESGIVSPMYICFKTQNNIDSDYLEYYFSTLLFKKEVQKRLEGSVRLCLSYESLCNIPFFVPNIDEQKRISRELSLLSSKINIEDCYLSILEKQKQYLLRQMFI